MQIGQRSRLQPKGGPDGLVATLLAGNQNVRLVFISDSKWGIMLPSRVVPGTWYRYILPAVYPPLSPLNGFSPLLGQEMMHQNGPANDWNKLPRV